jgi:twitching motility protein PilT
MAIITPSNPEAGATDADAQPRERLPIDRLFEALVRYAGSDLHLKVGRSPLIRVRGELHPLKAPPIDGEEMKRLIDPLLDARTRGIFEREGGADFSYLSVIDGTPTRFRINVLSQQGFPGLVARRISTSIPDFSGLHLPPVMQTLCGFDQGLILLAGVTGSGKSTTIASMLDWINHNYRKHILTLEDPVEFVFTEDKCLINQREIGQDVKDFGIGIKQAVREDPDIMLVGEMRDEETFLAAVQAAETGHLVFGTIHAPDAPGTITRILELFPPNMHASLRGALASNMKAIVAQKLLPSIKQGVSRVPTVEILIFNSIAKKLVREGEDEKIADFIRMSSRDGMQDFTASLKSLVDGGLIDVDTAIEVAPNREALRMALRGINVSQGGMLG